MDTGTIRKFCNSSYTIDDKLSNFASDYLLRVLMSETV